MIHKIQAYISKNHLPAAPARLIVALSGGADSVALLLVLQQMGYELVAAHCNFHLRGEESNRDEEFVHQLCERISVPLHVQHFQTEEFAQTEGISIEMAARQLRYDWFEKLRIQVDAVTIAVAHHADDNAETLLLNLTRGSGLHGLKGMLPQNGKIIRPLLCVKRKDLEKYLQIKHQDFVTDSTNLETIYKRNKIRHLVLPLLRQLNPDVDRCLSETAQRLVEAERLYNYAVQQQQTETCTNLPDGIRIDLKALTHSLAPETLLYEILTPYGFSSATITMISQQLERPTGSLFETKEYLAVFHRGNLEVKRRPQQLTRLEIPQNGVIRLNPTTSMKIETLSREELTEIPKQRDKVGIDKQAIQGKLYINSYQEGDRFQPFGMKGTKLISDYLTDRHLSLIEKMGALVLHDERGILWLINERLAQRAAITDKTKEILLLSLIKS